MIISIVFLSAKMLYNELAFLEKKGKMKKSKRDKAAYLGVDNSTLYNWRKYKPNLYRIVMLGFEFDAFLEQSKKNLQELSQIDEQIKDEIQKHSTKNTPFS